MSVDTLTAEADLETSNGESFETFIARYLSPVYRRLQGTPVEQRWTHENNRILARVFQESDTLGKLIAKARWIDLSLTREELARETELNEGTVAQLERNTDQKNTSTTSTHHKTYARIVRFFEEQDIDTRVIRAILDEVLGDDRGTVIGLQREWGYRAGLSPDEFEKKTGLTYGCLWQRRSLGTVPDFSELIHVAKKTGIVTARTPRTVWSHPEIVRARDIWLTESESHLSRPRPLSTIHAALQCAAYKTDSTSIRELGNGDLAWATAEDIANFRFCNWQSTRPLHRIIENVMDQDEYNRLKEVWIEDAKQEKRQTGYHAVFERLRREQGMTNNKLARVLGVSIYKPSQAVRVVASGESIGYTYGISRGQLAALVDQSPDGRGRKRLRKLDHAERERDKTRAGSGVNLALRGTREWWGITPEQAASITGFSRKRYMQLERYLGISEDTRNTIANLLEHAGQKKAEWALEQWKRYENPTSVEEAITLLAEDAGGYDTLARIIKPGIPSPTSPDGLKRMAKCTQEQFQKDTPAFPLLTHTVEHAGASVSPTLKRDWSKRYAERFAAENWKPLARVLRCIIGEKWVNIAEFAKSPEGKSQNLHQTAITRFFQKVNTTDKPFDPAYAFRILQAAGMEKGSPRWMFVETIAQTGSIEDALQTGIQAGYPLADLIGMTTKEWDLAQTIQIESVRQKQKVLSPSAPPTPVIIAKEESPPERVLRRLKESTDPDDRDTKAFVELYRGTLILTISRALESGQSEDETLATASQHLQHIIRRDTEDLPAKDDKSLPGIREIEIRTNRRHAHKSSY